jgi:hypothetical protein
MKVILSILIISQILICGFATNKTLQSYTFKPLKTGSITPQGWLLKQSKL